MKKLFYLSVTLISFATLITSCGSDDDGDENNDDANCFTCEGDFGGTVCDNEDGSFTVFFDSGIEQTVMFGLVGAESFEDVEDFIETEGCDENFLALIP